MTSEQMLIELRTLLDESVEGFWLDTECYAALSDGQREYASIILNQYKAKLLINASEPLSEVLRVLYTESTDSITVSYFTLPTDFHYDLSLYLDDPYFRTFYRREISRTLDEKNPYSYGDFYSLKDIGANKSLLIEIATPTSAVSYNFKYLKKTTDISATEEPILPEFTHQAIVISACSQLLKKSKQYDTSILQQKEFLSLIKYI